MWSHLFAGGVSPEIDQTPRHARTQRQVTFVESLLCAGHWASPSASAGSQGGLPGLRAPSVIPSTNT